MGNIIITFETGEKKEYPKGVKLHEIIKDIKKNYKFEIISAKFKNHIIGYEDAIMKSGNLELFDITTSQGNKIYERGLIYLFETCTLRVLGKDTKIKIRYPIDKGIWCEIDKKITEKDMNQIKELMHQKVKEGLPFEQLETSRLEAIEYFKKLNREDKVKTLSYTTSNFVKLYKFDGIYNYIIEEYSNWGELLNINNIGELNEAIIKRGAGEIINLSEILQDYKLLSIAEEIAKHKNKIKVVLLSGPSSSGKTTTAKKLALYLKTLGLKPHPLSLDDYFLSREKTPLDEDGKPDYEGIKAIDVRLFNKQMEKLLRGVEVVTPTYDFIEGKKNFNRPLKLEENDILIVEGLHALNEVISRDIPKENKYKIYISPLIYLNIDDDNRISLTDIRLLRRMIRDSRTRGPNPSKKLASWQDVRKGEEKYVFPYQDDADVIFNTFLVYELSALKSFVEPLLYSIPPEDPEYHTAIRLLEILKLVLPIPSNDIPKLSILREFIGRGYFE